MDEEKRALDEESCGEDKLRQKSESNTQKFLWLIFLALVIYLILNRLGIGVLANISVVLIGFSVVVIIHEFGHFVAAKLTGMKVEGFSVGFPPTFIGVLRTEKGLRIRILPSLIRKKMAEESADEASDEPDDIGKLTFTIGRCRKPGETEYRLGLIPFGGYVKILGQDDIGKVKSSEDPRSYANKPVWMRMFVISTGVLFNILLSVLLFIVVFHIGIKRIPPVIGGVRAGSPADRVGLKAGDEIIEIRGKSNDFEFADITMIAALSGKNEKIAVKVRREDGTVKNFEMVAEQEEYEMGEVKLFGIEMPKTLTVYRALGGDSAGNLYEQTGLKPGDRIVAVDGTEIRSHWQLEEEIWNKFKPTVTLTAERLVSEKDAEGLVRQRVELIESEVEVYIDSPFVPRLRVEKITRKLNDEQEQAFLQEGDIILSADDQENPTFKELREITEKYRNKELEIKVLRVDSEGVERAVSVMVKPEREEKSSVVMIGFQRGYDFEHSVVAEKIDYKQLKDSIGKIPRGARIVTVDGAAVSNYYEIAERVRGNLGEKLRIGWQVDEGEINEVAVATKLLDRIGSIRPVLAGYIVLEPLERLYKTQGIVGSVFMGYTRTVRYIRQAYLTIKRLLEGQVSTKNLMGPLGIAAFSYEVVRSRPFIDYVFFIGLISAFIGFLNFLPLLPLDGGHFVFLIVEKIKGSPVNEKIQFSLAAAGWLFFIGLALYVTFNDLQRIIRSFS